MGYPDSKVVTIIVLGINNKKVYYEYVYSIQVSAPHKLQVTTGDARIGPPVTQQKGTCASNPITT